MLVVIAIVAILAAILFPVFVSAKEHARQMRCLGNLTQLTRAVLLYAVDSCGKPPNPGGTAPELDWYGGTYGGFIWVWKGQLWPYVKNADIYMCAKDWRVPAQDAIDVANQKGKSDVAAWAKRDFPISYSMNSLLENRVLDTVRRTKDVMLMIHESRVKINDGSFGVDNNWDEASVVHFDGTTVAYLDAHAAWRSAKQLNDDKKNKVWDPTR